MSKRTVNIFFVVLLFIAVALVYQGVMPVLGQDPTIPTRTPTPDPNAPPTATPDDGGGEPPPPGPTNTPEAAATATNTPQSGVGATPTNTPVGGTPATGSGSAPDLTASGTPGELTVELGLPECDDTPVVQAIKDTVTLYAGPGGDYPVVASIIRDEIRLLLGRAEFADWWYIQYDLNTTAWVDDEDVNEYGNTGGVPLVEPPPINGNTPTPGPIWMPTARPACTTTPTPTPTETATATPTETATIVGVQADGSTSDGTTESVDSSGDGSNGVVSAALETPELVTSTPSATPYVLPAIGAGLLGLGLVVGLLARRSGQATPDSGEAEITETETEN